MKVLFKKIKNNHNRLRDDQISGIAIGIPRVGYSFYMTSEPRDISVGSRVTNTSVVIKLENIENGWRLFTKSGSIYEVLRAEK
jgi:hypothetical protein